MSENQKRKHVMCVAVCVIIVMMLLIISGLALYTSYNAADSSRRLAQIYEKQIELEDASREFMEATDFLSENAEAFILDGERRYLDEYLTELNETKRQEDAIQKLSDYPEFSYARQMLERAKYYSDKLMVRDCYAMRLVMEAKGCDDLPDAIKNTTLSVRDSNLSDKDKMKRAEEVLLDNAYFEQKGRVRRNVEQSIEIIREVSQEAATKLE